MSSASSVSGGVLLKPAALTRRACNKVEVSPYVTRDNMFIGRLDEVFRFKNGLKFNLAVSRWTTTDHCLRGADRLFYSKSPSIDGGAKYCQRNDLACLRRTR